MGYFDIFRVLRAGQEIANAETWKNRTALVNALAALLTAGAGIAASTGHQLPIDEQGIAAVATGLGTLFVFLLNIWSTYATTGRVGLPSRDSAVRGGVADGAGDAVAEGFDRNDPGSDDPVPYLKDTQNLG